MSEQIEITLSKKSVENAIKQLQQYKTKFQKKLEQFVRELANAGIPVIDSNMSQAQYKYDEKGIRSGSDTSIVHM